MELTPRDAASLEYSRRLYDTIVGWYKTAETKAQIILSLDGIVISLSTGALLSNPDTINATVETFGPETWTALTLVAVSIVASVLCALMTLVSRMLPPAHINRRHPGLQQGPETAAYPAEVMWFFQTISQLDEARYVANALSVTPEIENAALANQNFVLAGVVLKKHTWINWSFRFAAVGLVALVGASSSYFVRVAA